MQYEVRTKVNIDQLTQKQDQESIKNKTVVQFDVESNVKKGYTSLQKD